MKITTKRMALTGMVAAVYAVLTVLLPIPAYGDIQCRLSESLNLLIFINPVFAPGIILGCFIANIFSPVGLPDVIFGTLATAISAVCIIKFSRSLFTASIWPVVINGFIIGAMILVFFSEPPFTAVKFATFASTVMLGQFVAVSIIGVIIFSRITKNEKLLKLLMEL